MNHRPLTGRLLLGALLLTLLALVLWRAFEQPQTLRRTRLLMGTVVEIAVEGPEHEALATAVEAAFREMDRIEQLLSPHLSGSEVTLLTQAQKSAEVSAETAAVLRQALEVAARSDGAFNPVLGRLKQLWGIEGPAPRLPTPEEIRVALAGTGPGSLLLDGRRVSKSRPELAIDLGGIAKGYAVDRAAEILASAPLTWGVVDAGGDMRLLGRREGRPWRIGIQHPRRPDALLAVLAWPEPAAVVTSGDYERSVEIDGKLYHHLFDPRSGYPASACQSVTVVAPTAMLADALATAAFVLGPEAGTRLLEGWEGVEGLLVAADGTSHATAGLGGRLEWR